MRRLGDTCELINGRGFKKSEWTKAGLPIVRIQNLNGSQAFNYVSVDVDERHRIVEGDLLYAWSATIGPYIWRGPDAALNQHIFKVIPGPDVNREYLYYLLTEATNELRHAMHGSTMTHIVKSQLDELRISLPPLPKQRHIVAEIEKQLTWLDAGSQSLKRIESHLKKLFTAGIRTASSRLSQRDTQPFGTVVESIRNGISTKPTGNEGVEILKISAVRPFQVRFEERRFLSPNEAYAPFHLKDGDLLFTRYNGSREFVGVCAHVRGLQREVLYPDKLIRVRLKGGHEPRFYELMFNMGAARAHVASRIRTTAGQSGISAADLKSAPIPIASLEEQRVIVDEAERILSGVEHLACEVISARSKASRLHAAILAKAFSGQLVPQDPNDEPASVLLERIRKERAITAKKPARRRRAVSQEELTLQS